MSTQRDVAHRLRTKAVKNRMTEGKLAEGCHMCRCATKFVMFFECWGRSLVCSLSCENVSSLYFNFALNFIQDCN